MTRWTCENPGCGCLYIADCLDSCPHCYTPKGASVPKTSVAGGHTNRYEEPLTTTAEETPVEPVEPPVEPVVTKPVRRARKAS